MAAGWKCGRGKKWEGEVEGGQGGRLIMDSKVKLDGSGRGGLLRPFALLKPTFLRVRSTRRPFGLERHPVFFLDGEYFIDLQEKDFVSGHFQYTKHVFYIFHI